MTLTKSEKSPQMNKIYFTYCLAFSLISSQAFIHSCPDLINIIQEILFLIVALPRAPYQGVQNKVTTARLLFCLLQSYVGNVFYWLLSQVLAQSNTRPRCSLWALLLPGQLPGRLSSGNSWHCFSKSCLWLQRLKILFNHYADVLDWFCLYTF